MVAASLRSLVISVVSEAHKPYTPSFLRLFDEGCSARLLPASGHSLLEGALR